MNFQHMILIAIHEYGPENIGCACSNPFNAKLFASSKQLLHALKAKLMCNGCKGYSVNCYECRENDNRELVESITSQTIKEFLSNE